MRFLIALSLLLGSGAFDTWCGKHYEPLAPNVPPPPESRFTFPPKGDEHLLDFRCHTEKSIYIDGDEGAKVVVELGLSHDIGEIYEGKEGEVKVEIRYGGESVHSTARVGSTTLIDIDLTVPSLEPRELSCNVKVGKQEYHADGELLYLPRKDNGSAARLDRVTGALEVERDMTKEWEQVFPFGFYDVINPDEEESGSTRLGLELQLQPKLYRDSLGRLTLTSNLDRLRAAKGRGFNIIHPVPPSTSYAGENGDTAMKKYMRHAEELGLGVMYDMRHSFTSLDLVEEQVKRFKDDPALWVWYTADEPDGPSLPLDSTIKARNLIRRLDPYHPVALVFNCNDYYFEPYARGADILLVDVYHIAVNTAWSKKWSTVVNSTYGCGGCDECVGNYADLSGRIDTWSKRLRIMRSTAPIWVVPQGFDDGGDEFWWRSPTGDEVVVQTVLGVIHGVKGHCAWHAESASEDIMQKSSNTAGILYSLQDFILGAASTRRILTTASDSVNGIDSASWSRVNDQGEEEVLVLAVMTFYISPSRRKTFSPGVQGKIKRVLAGHVQETNTGVTFSMGRISYAGVIMTVK